MSQFYFDTTSATGSSTDAIGMAFVSLSDARAHAMSLLPVLGLQLPMNVGEFRSWTVTVRDDADHVVCHLIMAIINDDLSPGAGRVLAPMSKP